MSFLDRNANLTAEGEEAAKKVTGSKTTIPAGETKDIRLVFPYAKGLIKGAKIINTHVGDSLNFKILDTDTNAYSQAPVEAVGPNYTLNQFGFDVYLPDGFLDDTADFAGTLYQGMILCCEYTNNTSSEKVVYMNSDIYELTKA
jgi:hypothetical protein